MMNERAQRLRSHWSLLTERHGTMNSQIIESKRFDVSNDICLVKGTKGWSFCLKSIGLPVSALEIPWMTPPKIIRFWVKAGLYQNDLISYLVPQILLNAEFPYCGIKDGSVGF